MKVDRKLLLWGAVIPVATVVIVFKFPNFRLPFSARSGEAIVVSAMLLLYLTAPYRKLWKRAGYWGLLSLFVGIYWLITAHLPMNFGVLQLSVIFGITGAAEFLLFALLVLRLYRRGPEGPRWLG